MQDFSEFLFSLRRNKTLKQSQVADFVGVSRTTYSDWERGKTEPSLTHLVRLSEFFKISLDELIGSNSEKGNLIVMEQIADYTKKGNLKGNLIGNLSAENQAFPYEGEGGALARENRALTMLVNTQKELIDALKNDIRALKTRLKEN